MRPYCFATLIVCLIFFISCGSQKNLSEYIEKGTVWQLTTLSGTEIDPAAYKGRGMPHITFTADNKILGNSGCNDFSGSYNLNNEGGLNISQFIATKMFCDGVNENGFFESLDKVTTFKVSESKLTLMNGTEAILEFVPKQ